MLGLGIGLTSPAVMGGAAIWTPAQLFAASQTGVIYEPSPAVVLKGLLPRFVEMMIYHAVLEAIASEQSARMVAMRNATDNGKELVDELTLMYNKARQ